jgi:hypothetical protein
VSSALERKRGGGVREEALVPESADAFVFIVEVAGA